MYVTFSGEMRQPVDRAPKREPGSALPDAGKSLFEAFVVPNGRAELPEGRPPTRVSRTAPRPPHHAPSGCAASPVGAPLCGGVAAERERLHDAGVRLRALPELVQGQAVVVVRVHLVEDLVHPLLRRVLVLRRRLLALQKHPKASEGVHQDRRALAFDMETQGSRAGAPVKTRVGKPAGRARGGLPTQRFAGAPCRSPLQLQSRRKATRWTTLLPIRTTIWYIASTMLYISSRVMKPSLSTSYSRNAPAKAERH